MLTDKELEAALAAPRPAPRVTPERIEAIIADEKYTRLTGTLTVCVLTLANGFTVLGQSACASPENFDEAIGNKLARDDAKRKVWALEGYALRNQLADDIQLVGYAGSDAPDQEYVPAGRRLVQVYADNLEAAIERIRANLAGGSPDELTAALALLAIDGEPVKGKHDEDLPPPEVGKGFLDRSIDAIENDLPGLGVNELQQHLSDERRGKTRVRLVQLIEKRLEQLGASSAQENLPAAAD